MDEEMVLCAASSYEQKYYLNPEFESLPEAVKQELQIMCVLYTADVGGVLLLVFDENGNLELKVEHNEGDFSFDEIGSVLKIKELQNTKEELFKSLEMFYKVFYLGEEMEEIYKNCKSPKQKLIIHGAGHCESYYKDRDAYEGAMDSFIGGIIE